MIQAGRSLNLDTASSDPVYTHLSKLKWRFPDNPNGAAAHSSRGELPRRKSASAPSEF
jgi:hypothetical protein